MSKTILILRGVDSEDDLAPLGLGVAREYADADIVIVIGENGNYRIMKSRHNNYILNFINTDTLNEISVGE